MSTKVAPWLQGLSDAWDVPQEKTARTAISSASHDASSLRGTQSRIPRRSLSGLPSSLRGQTISSQGSVQRHRQPLGQMTDNDVNTTRQPSESKFPRNTVKSYASIGSTIDAGTVQLRSKSASPTKKQETLEWRRRLLRGGVGYGDNTDLFGPSGLENIFAQPQGRATGHAAGREHSAWLVTDASTPIPSSPPLLSQETRTGQPLPHADGQTPSLSGAAFDQFDDEGLRSDPFDLQTSRMSSKRDDTGLQNNISLHQTDGDSLDEQLLPAAEPHRTISGQTEIEQENFSPVFISKQASANGQIAYAALDSHTIRESKGGGPPKECMHYDDEPSSEDNRQADMPNGSCPVVDVDGPDGVSTILSHDFSFSENLPTGSPFPNLGKNVQYLRGGYSQQGSFKHRPLSPSQLPNDSRPSAQTDGTSPATNLAGFPNSVEGNHNGPESNVHGSVDSPSLLLRSPLKLFGNHDTFTSNRLLRRISQLNPDGTIAQRAKPQTPRSATGRQSVRSMVSNGASDHSGFGVGDLDEYEFSAEITITSPTDPEKSASDRSPGSEVNVPGSKIPVGFKFERVSDDEDTHYFAQSHSDHKSQIQPRSSSDASLVRNSSPTIDQCDEFPQPCTAKEPTLQGQAKRPPSSPFKDAPAKRRRTFQAADFTNALHKASKSLCDQTSQTDNKLLQNGHVQYNKSRGNASHEVLPARPVSTSNNRLSSVSSNQHVLAELEEATEKFVSEAPERLEAVIEQIEYSLTSDSIPSLQQQAEDLASEVAAFTLNRRKASEDAGVRKRSVTTQDFLNEAMMVMKLIRAKARPQSGLGSVAESGAETFGASTREVEAEAVDERSMLRLSRPPSREGSGWRPRSAAQHAGARMASNLRKYQEDEGKDDTDFIANSLATLQVDGDASINEQVVVVDEQANIRIAGPLPERDGSVGEDDSRPASQRSQQSVAFNTRSTQGSGETLTGRTTQTNSTRKSENVGTLAPDSVAHLIGNQIGGMTFDKEKKLWVRMPKGPGKKNNSFLELPSTVTSDDDPFREISDLKVDEQVESRRISSPGKVVQAHATAQEKDTAMNRESPMLDYAAALSEDTTHANKTFATRPVTRDGNPSIVHLHSSSIPSRYSALASSQYEKIETRATSWNDEELERMSKLARTHHLPTGSLAQELLDQQNVSGLSAVHEVDQEESFTLPADSCPDVQRADILEQEHHEQDDDESISCDKQEASTADDEVSVVSDIGFLPPRRTPQRSIFQSNTFHRGARQVSLRRQTLKSKLTEDTLEQNELSFVAPLPGDRMISLSLSVSRPVSSRVQPRDITEVHSSPSKKDSSFLLSDLPDFTVHDDDNERPSEKALATRLAQHATAEITDRYALAVKDLVKTLTDVKEDEPYWEDLRQLDLHDRGLGSLYGLEDFCTEIEDLNISSNSIAHLQGAPHTIRRLIARSNCLSSLTPWNHLRNLQYLDISHNEVTDLNSLNGLVHLRELRADDNLISDLNGIAHLDALLKLSVRRNKIRTLNLDGYHLNRLTDLDVRDNAITRVEHIDNLTTLKALLLDGNELRQGVRSKRQTPSLETLSMRNCKMQRLDVTPFPHLHQLYVDDNYLHGITGLAGLSELDVLSMRRQALPEGTQITIFDSTLEARVIYLSGNDLPSIHLSESCLNLQHLELALCGLASLPDDFGLKLANLRTIDLSFNALTDVRPLLNMQKAAHPEPLRQSNPSPSQNHGHVVEVATFGRCRPKGYNSNTALLCTDIVDDVKKCRCRRQA